MLQARFSTALPPLTTVDEDESALSTEEEEK